MSDTHQTHINVFKQDVEKAHQAALGAVDELKRCIDALEAKYRSLLAESGPEGQAALQEADEASKAKKASKGSKDPDA